MTDEYTQALADMSADPPEMYEAQPKRDGRRNNGGPRLGTGPKPMPDKRKVRRTMSLSPETDKRLVGYAVAMDMSMSEAAEQLLAIMLSNAAPHRL